MLQDPLLIADSLLAPEHRLCPLRTLLSVDAAVFRLQPCPSAAQGHTLRLGRLAFHPMGQHLATASYDETWRLWDVETGQSLVEQEGHSRSVYTVGFHRDGSLAASGGLDAIGELAPAARHD